MVYRIASPIALAISALSLSTPSYADCGWWDPLGSCKAAEVGTNGLKESIAKLQQELQETRKAALEATDKAVVAVPGERYLRLIDDLNGPDEGKKQQARAFLKNLANIDPDVKYELAVSFQYNDSIPFFVDLNRFQAPRPEILQFFVENSISLDSTPKRSVPAAPAEADVRHLLKEKSATLLHVLRGDTTATMWHGDTSPNCANGNDIYCVVFTWEKPIWGRQLVSNPFGSNASFVQAQKDLKESPDKFDDRTGRFADAITDVVMTAFPFNGANNGAAAMAKDWSPLDQKNFVVVFLEKESFEKHAEDWSITLSVHEKGNPDKTLYQRPALILKKDDFDPQKHKPLVGLRGKTFYWGFREMTGELDASVSQLDALKKLRETINNWDQFVQAQ